MSASSINVFDDPEAFAHAIHNFSGRVRPARRGAYGARLTLVRLPTIHLAMSEEAQARHLTCHTAPDRTYFRLKHDDEPPNLRNGATAQPGTVGVGRGAAEVDDRAEGWSRWRSLSIPREALAMRADALFQRSLSSMLGASGSFRPAAGAFARVARLQRHALRMAAEAPAVLADPVAAGALDEQLCTSLLAMIASTTPAREYAVGRRQYAIMRRVLAYIEAHRSRPIALVELCIAGDCSAKLLQTMFLRLHGMTPNRYLRLCRLWGARNALIAAEPAATTVTRIAFDWGFWELGRFAGAYRGLFGESPSRTLGRTPERSAHGEVSVLRWRANPTFSA